MSVEACSFKMRLYIRKEATRKLSQGVATSNSAERLLLELNTLQIT